MPQAEKNRLLVDLALRGLNVVRLKGGDTAFFGGSAEEAESLAAAGVRVVVIPGVTAASAAAAASCLPLTDRSASSWVLFATGHGASSESIPVPWEEIAGLRGGTIVIYMGLANLDGIVGPMLAGGCAPDTPCMVVQGASTGMQRIETSTLSDVVEDCRKKQLKPPALVVVGQVVRHRTRAGTSSMPLSGKRVLVTCCAQDMEATCEALRNRGAEPLPYPTFKFEHHPNPDAWLRFSTIASSGGWCAFAGRHEVQVFADALLRYRLDWRSLSRLRFIVFGTDADAALLQTGIQADVKFPAIGDGLSRKELNQDDRAIPANLVLPSNIIRIDRSEWAEVLELELMRAEPAAWEPHWPQEVQNNPPDIILFSNPASAAGYVKILGSSIAHCIAQNSRIIATDEATAKKAIRLNLPCIVDAEFLRSPIQPDSTR
jgi:uroporphyrinogen III methyltransferase/synthase